MCVWFSVKSMLICRDQGHYPSYIIPAPLCPRACRTFNLFTVQENRALASRMKNLYRWSKEKALVNEPAHTKGEGLSAFDGWGNQTASSSSSFLDRLYIGSFPNPSASPKSSSPAVQLGDCHPTGQSRNPPRPDFWCLPSPDQRWGQTPHHQVFGSLSPLSTLTVGGWDLWNPPLEQEVPEAYIPSSDLNQQRALSLGESLMSL